MVIFSFDATASTHDLLKTGITEATSDELRPGTDQVAHRHHRVVVAAEDRDTAALLACQMVSCTSGICTGLYDRI